MGRIFRWLKINPDEVGLFLWVALLLFLVNVAAFLLNNYAEAAFLKRFGVEYLPIITAVNAIVTFVLLSAVGGRLSRLRGDKVVAWTLLACAAFCALLRLVVPLGFSLIYPVLYILKTQFTVLLAFLFWNLANDLFSTRQSKRLFPLITTGGILGGLLGSFATPLLIRLTNPDNLLLLFPLVAAAGAFCSLRLGLLAPGSLAQAKPKAGAEKPTMLGELRQVRPLVKKSTLAQVLLLLTLLPNIIIPILNYQFSFVVNDTFTSEASMIDFYGYFRGAQNTISLLLSLFVGRIYGRFGLPVALMFHPANYLLTFVAFLFQFNIFVGVYSGVSVGVLRRTINGPATAALYGLLLPQDRAVLRPFLRGTVVRIGILAGSGLLWVANEFIAPRYLSLFAIVFSLAWLGATLLLKRNYAGILIDLVQNALPEFHKMGKGGFAAICRGTDLAAPLLQRLRDAHGDEAAWCAEMLQQASPERLDDAILEKLPGSDDLTRLRLLPFLSEAAGSRALDTFLTFIDPNKPELMVALARTVKRVYPQMPDKREREIFERAQLPEVKACFLGWMNRSDSAGFDSRVRAWLNSDEVQERRAGVLAIGEARAVRLRADLALLLETETDPTVMALALHSLGRLDEENSCGALIAPFLQHPEESVRLAAVEALPMATDEQVNRLIHSMGDASESVRKRAVARLEGLPADKHHLLVARMGTNSRWTREGLFKVAGALELDDIDVLRFCRNQLKAAYETLEIAAFIRSRPQNAATRMMLEHLEEVRRHRVHNSLGVLSSRDPEGRLAIALRGLQSGGARERSDSIEAIESLLDRQLLELLLPMRDERPEVERLAIGRRRLDLELPSAKDAIRTCLADANWVSVVMMLECLAIWGNIEPYRDQIKQLGEEHYGAVVHTAEHAIASAAGHHEEALSCLIERINIIRKVDLFGALTIGQLAAVAWQSEVETYADGEVIASAEQSGRGLLMVVSGEVVFLQQRNPGEKELHRIGDGEWFGAAVMFGMTPPPSMIARSSGSTLLLRINRQDFQTLANQYPDIALGVCTGLAQVAGDVMAERKNRPAKPPTVPGSDQLLGSFCTSEGECTLVDRIFFLRQINLFSQLENEPLTALATIGEEIKLARGDRLLGSTPEAGALFLILEGELTFWQEETLYDRKGAGEYFGLATIFGLNVDDFTVVAEKPSTLLRISREDFHASVMDHPVIAIRACERLSQMQGNLIYELLEEQPAEETTPDTP